MVYSISATSCTVLGARKGKIQFHCFIEICFDYKLMIFYGFDLFFFPLLRSDGILRTY